MDSRVVTISGDQTGGRVTGISILETSVSGVISREVISVNSSSLFLEELAVLEVEVSTIRPVAVQVAGVILVVKIYALVFVCLWKTLFVVAKLKSKYRRHPGTLLNLCK